MGGVREACGLTFARCVGSIYISSVLCASASCEFARRVLCESPAGMGTAPCSHILFPAMMVSCLDFFYATY